MHAACQRRGVDRPSWHPSCNSREAEVYHGAPHSHRRLAWRSAFFAAGLAAAASARYRIELSDGRQILATDLPVARGSVLTYHPYPAGPLTGVPTEMIVRVVSDRGTETSTSRAHDDGAREPVSRAVRRDRARPRSDGRDSSPERSSCSARPGTALLPRRRPRPPRAPRNVPDSGVGNAGGAYGARRIRRRDQSEPREPERPDQPEQHARGYGRPAAGAFLDGPVARAGGANPHRAQWLSGHRHGSPDGHRPERHADARSGRGRLRDAGDRSQWNARDEHGNAAGPDRSERHAGDGTVRTAGGGPARDRAQRNARSGAAGSARGRAAQHRPQRHARPRAARPAGLGAAEHRAQRNAELRATGSGPVRSGPSGAAPSGSGSPSGSGPGNAS